LTELKDVRSFIFFFKRLDPLLSDDIHAYSSMCVSELWVYWNVCLLHDISGEGTTCVCTKKIDEDGSRKNDCLVSK
jgi:hypothetical protein